MVKRRKKVSDKQAARRPVTPKVIHAVTDEQRQTMIAEAAYFFAEQRGFKGNEVLDDWLRAEAEIDVRLSKNE